MSRALGLLLAAFAMDREMILRPLRGSQTLFVTCPKREPVPAAKTTIASRRGDFTPLLWQTFVVGSFSESFFGSWRSPFRINRGETGVKLVKLTPHEVAEKIKQDHAKRRGRHHHIVLPEHVQTLEEMGLLPTNKPRTKDLTVSHTSKKRLLTKRQEKLMREMGLLKDEPDS